VQADIARMRAGGGEKEGVAVRCRVRGGRRREIAAGARLVLDDDRLAERARELVGDDARLRVGAAAGRKRHDDAQRMARPVLCAHGAERRGQNEERGEEADEGHACGPGRQGGYFIMRAAPLTTSAAATTRRNTRSLRPE